MCQTQYPRLNAFLVWHPCNKWNRVENSVVRNRVRLLTPMDFLQLAGRARPVTLANLFRIQEVDVVRGEGLFCWAAGAPRAWITMAIADWLNAKVT